MKLGNILAGKAGVGAAGLACGCCGGKAGCRCAKLGRCLVCARCPSDCRCPNLGKVFRGARVVCVAPRVEWRPPRVGRARPRRGLLWDRLGIAPARDAAHTGGMMGSAHGGMR